MYERVKPTLQSKSVNLKHPYPDIWGYFWVYVEKLSM